VIRGGPGGGERAGRRRIEVAQGHEIPVGSGQHELGQITLDLNP
jgi:hypothetical protein